MDAYIWSVEEGMEVSKALVKSFVYRQNTENRNIEKLTDCGSERVN